MEGDHMLKSELVRFHCRESQGFKVSRLMGRVCVCMCVGGGVERGLLVCNDSSAGIKCGTLIWVKIMESYMSLSMSAFHSMPEWKVTAGRASRGGQRCRMGIRRPWGRPCGWPAVRLSGDSLSSHNEQLEPSLPSFPACVFTCLFIRHSNKADGNTEEFARHFIGIQKSSTISDSSNNYRVVYTFLRKKKHIFN